jgi:putative transposase
VDLTSDTSNRHLVYSSRYHVLWCPKDRRTALVGLVAKRLERLLRTRCGEMKVDMKALQIRPRPCASPGEFDPPFDVHRLVKRLNGHTSPTLRREVPALKSRFPTLWTHAYFVSPVGGAPLSVITQYVEHQKDV